MNEAPFSVSVKPLQDPMVTVRADTSEQMLANLDAAVYFVPAVQQLQAAVNVATAFPVAAVTPPPAAPPVAPPPAVPPPTAPAYTPPPVTPGVPAPACAHGARRVRTGTNDRGPWTGYFCPLPKERKAEQCDPIFA